jgi:aspartyl-tRNA(Asn)/glutamyl-tRNA(Gln) amidotransferase subunit B
VEWLGVLNYNKKTMEDVEIKAEHVIELLQLLEQNRITPLNAKDILRKFIPKSYSPKTEAKDALTIIDEKQLGNIIDDVLKKNEKSVNDFKNGEEKAFNFLIGQVMQATQKRADFLIVKFLLIKKIK